MATITVAIDRTYSGLAVGSGSAMSTGTTTSFIPKIGETAGKVWHFLNQNGPRSLTKLAVDLGEPRDLVMLALGWLAREDKIEITEDKRSRMVSLKS
jgi:hypothetical protein